MLPAAGMEPVHEMQLEKVWELLRKGIRTMSKKQRGWAFDLGRKLKAGRDVPEWQDDWARAALIEMREPDIGPLIDRQDSEAARGKATNYEEF